MMTAAQGGTNPAAGVIVARPATAPVSAPVTLGLCSRHQVSASQVTIAAAAAVFVFTNAGESRPPRGRGGSGGQRRLTPSSPGENAGGRGPQRLLFAGLPRLAAERREEYKHGISPGR